MYSRELINNIIAYLENGTVPSGISRQAEWRWRNHYTAENGYQIETLKKLKILKLHGRPVIAKDQIPAMLQGMYNDPTTSRNGRDSFYNHVQSRYAGIPKEEVHSWLKRQETYQLHRSHFTEKVVRPIVVKQPGKYFQIDLVDMSELAHWNKGMHWLLNAIDLNSKWFYCAAIKNKEGPTVAAAVARFLTEANRIFGQYPTVVQSDNGSEFISGEMDEVLKKHDIKHLRSLSHTPQSQGQVEKAGGTIKKLIFAYFTQHGTKTYVDVLPDLVQNINNTRQTTTKQAPNVVLSAKPAVQREVNQNIQRAASNRDTNRHVFAEVIKVGDKVRVANSRLYPEVRKAQLGQIGGASKKYLTQWSDKLFTVAAVRNTKPNKSYSLKEEPGEFARQDLLLANTVEKSAVRTLGAREKHLEELHEARRESKNLPKVEQPAPTARTLRPRINLKSKEKLNL